MADSDQSNDAASADRVGLAAGIVSAYVANNNVTVAELPALLAGVHAALLGLGRGAASVPQAETATPAQIRRSITDEALISFEDGKPYKTLRRHLSTRGISPEAYRAKWGLPKDYPMTASAYSEARSKLARGLGLGRKRSAEAPSQAEPVAEAPKRAIRPRRAEKPADA